MLDFVICLNMDITVLANLYVNWNVLSIITSNNIHV